MIRLTKTMPTDHVPTRSISSARTARYVRIFALTLRYIVELWWLRLWRSLRGKRQSVVAARLYTRQARKFVAFATGMGGLIIKVGQLLSVRIDLLPKEYIDVLSTLQDTVPAVPTPLVVHVVETELGQPLPELFASFDHTPIAAASLGQVHRATLIDGTPVAVKVLRPGIEDLVATDLTILRNLLKLLDRLFTLRRLVDIEGLASDFATTIGDELDYVKEGQHAEEFQRDLLFNPYVDIPRIYWERSSRRVLTMEFMDGVRVDDLTAIDAWGIDRHELAENLGGLFFSMVLDSGRFHADPHPGNIFVRPDGVIQLIDFGQVGTIAPTARTQYASLLAALVRHDAPGIIDAMRALGFLGPGADTVKLAELVGPLLDVIIGDVTGFYSGTSIIDALVSGQVKLNIGADQLAEIQRFIFTQPIIMPANTAFLGKALITVVGLCLRLDPTLDLFATAAPFVSGQSTWTDLLDKTRSAMATIVPTTRRMIFVAKRLGDGSFEADIAHLVDSRIDQAVRRQTKTLVSVIAAAVAVVVLVARRR